MRWFLWPGRCPEPAEGVEVDVSLSVSLSVSIEEKEPGDEVVFVTGNDIIYSFDVRWRYRVELTIVLFIGYFYAFVELLKALIIFVGEFI